MDLQHRNQQSLNLMGKDIQMDIWKKTNYEAQMAQMKAAGLNPSLMYGKGGQGGVTGSQSGGSAASGTAQQAPMIDLSALNFMRTKAEIDLLRAQAENLRGTTPVPKATAENLGAQTELTKLQAQATSENMATFLKTAEASLNKLVTDTQAQIANIANTEKDTQKKTKR